MDGTLQKLRSKSKSFSLVRKRIDFMTVSVLQNTTTIITPHHGCPAMNINAHVDRAVPPHVTQKFQLTEFPTQFRPMLLPNCEQRKCCNVSFHGVNFH